MGAVRVRRLGLGDVGLVASLDRSEQVETEYRVVGGELRQRPVTMADIPSWEPDGDGPFSVAPYRQVCTEHLQSGRLLLGAFERDEVMGLAIVDPVFEPPMAWPSGGRRRRTPPGWPRWRPARPAQPGRTG